MRDSPLLAIGFRPFYALGALFAIIAIALWLVSFTGMAYFGGTLQGVFWHSHEMVFGFSAAIIAGFLFTAVRNWTGRPTPSGVILGAIALLWVAARVLLQWGNGGLGIILDVIFLPVVAIAVAIPIFGSANKRNYKVVGIVAAIALLHFVFHLSAGGVLPSWLPRVSLLASIDIIVILFALIGGRVIPAFTRNAVAGSNPRHEAWLEFISFGTLALIPLIDLSGGAVVLAAWAPMLLLIVAAVAQLLRLALWQPQMTLNNPLLWMMPVAYSWLPIALLLRAAATTGAVLPGAWIHALTMGAVSSLMMAMMMRSTLGHTGRKLEAGRADLVIFLLLQLAAVIRILAGGVGDYRTMTILAGIVWMIAFAEFLVRYGPMLLRPRIDGRPG